MMYTFCIRSPIFFLSSAVKQLRLEIEALTFAMLSSDSPETATADWWLAVVIKLEICADLLYNT